MSTEAIQARLNDAREEMMRMRFQQASGELTDFTRLRQARHDIARLLTVLAERARGMETEVSNE
jgi:large subunit ribosomal protein L29